MEDCRPQQNCRALNGEAIKQRMIHLNDEIAFSQCLKRTYSKNLISHKVDDLGQ